MNGCDNPILEKRASNKRISGQSDGFIGIGGAACVSILHSFFLHRRIRKEVS